MTTSPTADIDEDPGRFTGLAESDSSELWYNPNTGEWFVVHYAEGDFDPPIALLYHIPDDETFKAITGFDSMDTAQADKKLTTAQIDSVGAIRMGSTDDLPETEGNPWTGFKAKMERASKVQPWLLDAEVYALVGAAYLEGRELQDWELQATEWWQSRNDREREWARISLGDPKTAEQMLADSQTKVQAMFESIGAVGNDKDLLNWMSTKYTTGQWSQDYLARQIEAVTSGWYDVDSELEAFINTGGIQTATTIDRTEEVRGMFARWLGPAYPPTDAQIRDWSTKLRNSASADEELAAHLRAQRMALFPEYANENLTYEDIASPWRGVFNSVWGQMPDEMDSMFQDIIRMNNLTEAQRLLRRTGLETGNAKVMQDALSGAMSATGGRVRRAE